MKLQAGKKLHFALIKETIVISREEKHSSSLVQKGLNAGIAWSFIIGSGDRISQINVFFPWKPSAYPETYTADYIVLCDSSFKDRTIVRGRRRRRRRAARCTGSGRFNASLWIWSAVRVFFYSPFPLTTINQLPLPPPYDWLTLHLFFGMHLPKCAPPPLPTHTHTYVVPQSSLSQKQWFYLFIFLQVLHDAFIIAHLRNLFGIPRFALSTSSSSSTINKSLICLAGAGAETYQLPLQKQHVLSDDEQKRQVAQSCKSIKQSYRVYIRSNYCNPNCIFHCTAIPDLQSRLKNRHLGADYNFIMMHPKTSCNDTEYL